MYFSLMNYLLIPDKFKGSATAEEVIESLIRGIQKVDRAAHFHKIIASDGGDGFLSSIAQFKQLQTINIPSKNAYLEPIDSCYLWDKKSKTAYIELANTAGIVHLNNRTLRILDSSTIGVGIQLKDALDKGATTIYMGLGGSATNDAGLGILYAIGYEFYDQNNKELIPNSGNLDQIQKIIPKAYPNTKFYIVNDVDNPLYGPKGAAAVYAPQKGATPAQVKKLDQSLKQLSNLIKRDFGIDEASTPGTGAAGGTAYGLKAFLNAEFIPGFEFLKDRAQLEQLISNENIDYIITGEGHFDEQSLYGKLIEGILKLAKTYRVPSLIVCGASSVEEKHLEHYPIESIIQLKNEDRSLEFCITNTPSLIEEDIYIYLKSKA